MNDGSAATFVLNLFLHSSFRLLHFQVTARSN